MKKIVAIIRRTVYLMFGSLNDFFFAPSPDIFVLCYHSISDGPWEHSVKPQEFRKQIKYLISRFHFLTLSDLYLYLSKRKKISTPAVILNFDDGYKDILRVRRLLKKLAIRPSLFLLSDKAKVDRKQLGSDKEFLSEPDIKKLQKDGWEIGSHGATHTNMLRLNQGDIEKEVVRSKHNLEKKLKTKINYFAYPNGNYNRQILNCVKKASYRLGLTMNDEFINLSTHPLLIPRIGINVTHSFAEFKVLFSPINIRIRKFIKCVFYEKK